VTLSPNDTFSAVRGGVEPALSLSTRIRSKFSSNRGTFGGAGEGTVSLMLMPGSRNGRATPWTTP
jgi:hypothetical protein